MNFDDSEKEEIRICIEGFQKMINRLDTRGMQYFHHLCEQHGDVSDYKSFRLFFNSFLTKFPKKEITEKYNTDEEAKRIWTKIDTNLNDKLDVEECLNLVREMISFLIYILKSNLIY